MNAVGIDVSSRKSTVAVLRPLGEVVCLPFDVTFTNIHWLSFFYFAILSISANRYSLIDTS